LPSSPDAKPNRFKESFRNGDQTRQSTGEKNMPFQQKITSRQPLGLPGAFYDGSIRRVTAGTLSADSRIGRAVAHNGEGKVMAGGGADGKFAGVLVNPKTLPRQSLSASLEIKAGATVEYADKGRIVIVAASNANAKDGAMYNTATGEIAPYTGGDLPAGHAVISNAEFFLGAEAGGPAVLQLA
jgi:hypothetical protein